MDNDLKSLSTFLESMNDNIKKLSEENVNANDDSETFKEMFNPSSLDSVTGFLGVLMRSLVHAPETFEFSEHLTSTFKTIAKTELNAYWNGGVMKDSNNSNGFINSCKITAKIYDEWQSAVMRLFSHILTHDSKEKRDITLMKQCCNLICIIGNVLCDSILDVTELNLVNDGNNNSSRNSLSSKIIDPMPTTWTFDPMFKLVICNYYLNHMKLCLIYMNYYKIQKRRDSKFTNKK